jgi:8-oxo-dGTP pyrophosphatase MutT (NUDIX family)
VTLDDVALFSPYAVAERARSRLYTEARLAPEDAAHSDLAIAGMNPTSDQLAEASPAAVLIPLVARPGGVTMLLTQRSSALRTHSGQIAFPGGRIDGDDEGPQAAAFREAEEEIGLAPGDLSPLGYLGPYFSTTGFRITPVVALMRPDAPLQLNPGEVDEVFETPLAFLMDPANHQTHEREWRGAMRRYFAMPHGDRYIWGVTAGIIRMLWLRLYAPRHP